MAAAASVRLAVKALVAACRASPVEQPEGLSLEELHRVRRGEHLGLDLGQPALVAPRRRNRRRGGTGPQGAVALR